MKDLLDRMLDYYEIDTGENIDELPPKQVLDKMINTVLDNYERQIVSEIIKNNRPPESEDGLAGPQDMNEEGDVNDPDFGSFEFDLDPETEKFIFWISNVLYSADHKVTVTKSDDGNNITINLVKINDEKGT